MWPLEHNAVICFAGANKKVFVFMATEEQTDIFPATLTNKYTVSKVLGRGATGEVRLGFRIPDLHRVAIKIICKRTNSTISTKEASQYVETTKRFNFF
jgi:serine/threonine-protein kinase Chk2